MAGVSIDSQISKHLESLKAGFGPRPVAPPSHLAQSGNVLPAPQPLQHQQCLQPAGGYQQASAPAPGLAAFPPGAAVPGGIAPASGALPQPCARVAAASAPTGPSEVVVSVAVDNIACRYQLSEADLQETFQRWGPLRGVQIYREGSQEVGVLTFADATDAADAQRQLNGSTCSFDGGYNGVLNVVSGPPERLGSRPGPNGAEQNGRRGPLPWSCKIMVQADQLHPAFPVALKIVGEDNKNVNHIRTQMGCAVQLRGRGSGYIEPDTGRELQDGMALWLASDDPRAGQQTCEMAQDLFKSVYEEHSQWCLQNGHGQAPSVAPVVVMSPEEPAATIPALGLGVCGGVGPALTGGCGGQPMTAPGALGNGPGPSPGGLPPNYGPCHGKGFGKAGVQPGVRPY